MIYLGANPWIALNVKIKILKWTRCCTEPTTSKLRIDSCIHDGNHWMSTNKLMLNHDKTELLVLHAFHRPQPPLESILVCSDVIYSSNSAKNIGAWFDTVMSMDKQVNSIRQSASYHLRNIAQISKHISFRHRETLIHAFVTSKIDHCNILLSGRSWAGSSPKTPVCPEFSSPT